MTHEFWNDEKIEEFIRLMQPKIKKSLRNTRPQEREDLEQELKLKIIQSIRTIILDEPPGFWDFKRKFEQKIKTFV